MTEEQWNKVIERARRNVEASGDPVEVERMLDEIRKLTRPMDEGRLDTDNAADVEAEKAAQIVELETELAKLKAR
jgi:hypothetical protein